MDAPSTAEALSKSTSVRKSSHRRRRDRVATLMGPANPTQLPLSIDSNRYINEIATLEEKLADNWEELQATLDQLKEDDKMLGLSSFEGRDEYWKLLQVEKKSEKLKGPMKKWSGRMEYRDQLGAQRSKLLDRLEQVEGREARRSGDSPKARASRQQSHEQRDALKGDLRLRAATFQRKEVRGSEPPILPFSEQSSKRLSGTKPSGALFYKPYGESGRIKEYGEGPTATQERGRKDKQGKEDNGGREGRKGKGKERLPTLEVRHKRGTSEEDDEDGSDSSTNIVLAPPAISQKFLGNNGQRTRGIASSKDAPSV